MPQRILIADDSAGIRDVLRDALADEGYDISEAASGDEVLNELRAENASRPDLALMDIRMPGKDGLEVLRTLRASQDDELPIIVMTAFGSASTAIEAMKLGAFDYIAKPFELDEVTVAIERFFERRDLSDRVVRLLAETKRDESTSDLTGTLDYQISRRWSLRTELGTTGGAFDLLWSHRY